MDLQKHYSKPYITASQLAVLLQGSHDRRYSWVKRALKNGVLTSLKRGIYLIERPPGVMIDSFEIAQQLYGPSYISFESALEYHGWIPEAVYIITSACSKRSTKIQTSLDTYHYQHVPDLQFFMGVERIAANKSIFLMAHPWKALADYVYVHRKQWMTLADIAQDMRIEEEVLRAADRAPLKEIAQYYPSSRVRNFAKKLYEHTDH